MLCLTGVALKVRELDDSTVHLSDYSSLTHRINNLSLSIPLSLLLFPRQSKSGKDGNTYMSTDYCLLNHNIHSP